MRRPTQLELDAVDFVCRPGSIVQVIEDPDHDTKGMLLIVTAAHSWGVAAEFREGLARSRLISNRTFTWDKIEPTGGRALISAAWARIEEPKASPRHHP